jgi:hypothetical protein
MISGWRNEMIDHKMLWQTREFLNQFCFNLTTRTVQLRDLIVKPTDDMSEEERNYLLQDNECIEAMIEGIWVTIDSLQEGVHVEFPESPTCPHCRQYVCPCEVIDAMYPLPNSGSLPPVGKN